MTTLGILTEDGHKLSWSRCSRTDRGVHAMRNVVSFCARISRSEFDEFRQAHQLASRLNEVLPEDIRILSVFRAPMSFAARAAPFGRFYNYFVPLWALSGGHNERSSAALEAFRNAINQFQGTHYFHNFTTPKLRSANVCRRKGFPIGASGVVFDSDDSHDSEQTVHDDFARFDDSAFVNESHWEFKPQLQRTVFHASVGDPECIQKDSPPVVRVKLFGNSFMMHQIRFMMGVSIGIAAGVYPPDFIQKALVLPRFPMLPLAPAELLLQTDVKFINECLVNMVDESGYPVIRPPGIGDMELKQFRASKGVTPETLLPGVVCLNQDALAAEAAFFKKQVAPDIAAFAAGVFPEGYDNKRASLLPAWIDALHAQKDEVAATAIKVDNRYKLWLPSHEARQRDRAVNDSIRRRLAFDEYVRLALERASQGKKAPSLSHALDVLPKAFVPALALKFGVWDSVILGRVQLAVAECIVTKKWAADLTCDELLERVWSSGMMRRARAQAAVT